ncbi:cilia- and flagella-associated protein 46-like [Astyanax mexicanus]|uniref:cilia- and flagella-associated protein 46-like n=1 Tax=Astyanax mexicanus TaxID=7994 RepID=UPI0020CB69F5|nr:cilia- and flagella-associated protein 46-like [Astyanax mexicanus]
MELQIRHCLIQAQDKNDPEALKKAYGLIKDVFSGNTPVCLLPELYVLCSEQAIQLGCKEIAEHCLMMYFETNPPSNQFLCRAYFCQAQLNSPHTVTTVEDMDKAVMYYLKAIEISKDNPRYHFLVFNASLLYFQTVRAFLRPGQRQHLVCSLSQVVSALEAVQEPDYAWRAELMLHLVECLVDSGKHKEAAAFSKVTSEFIEAHKPEMYPRIFSIQVLHDLLDSSQTVGKRSHKLLVIYKIQKLKHIAEVSEVSNETAELKEILLLLSQSSQAESPASHSSSPDSDDSSHILLSDRIELLLELAFFCMQLKEHRVAEGCLKELQAIEGTTVAQRIKMECVECELTLKGQVSRIEDYTKSSVEAQLAVVWRLDALLQRAVREGEGEVTQCVCAAQWNSCLPLLQHNLRRSIKRPLLNLAHALDDINSTLLDIRCQVQAELAAIEEKEDRLEPALKHLHAALRLDERGQHQERLSSSLHLLQLRTSLYNTPTRPEDQAAVLIQQAKEGSGCMPTKKWRPMLVSAGTALAPDTFQMVLDADKAVQGKRHHIPVEQLAAKAQHHMTCIQKVEGHLARLEGGTDDRERMRLWASLVKVARKQEVWDICRAACRFCLLYDDGRWNSKKPSGELNGNGKPAGSSQGDHGGMKQAGERELLLLLAEVHFINAEVTIVKLRSEGMELSELPVRPAKKKTHQPENDSQWTLYRDWIQKLSAYATDNFLRGAELGAEIQEAWLVANAAVYLWNYNTHLLSKKQYPSLLPTFSRLTELLKQTSHTGDVVLLVLLCDAVAQGMIQPWFEAAGQIKPEQDTAKGGVQQQADKVKKGGGKVLEKHSSTHGFSLEAAAVQDIKKALEVCDYALRLSNGNEAMVPMMVRKQLISTWVNTKYLLQQQIGQKLDIDDESKNESVAAMSRVLVGVEMLLCNSNLRLMEFSVPSLRVLAQMAADCKWSDPVVELYVWSQLAYFACQSPDHDLVMTCTQNALQLEKTAIHKAKVPASSLYSVKTVKEMLSSSACLRGLSMLHKSVGHPSSYTAALDMLQSSISYAEQAGSWTYCGSAAKHYWNACLPLVDFPEQRQQLREPLELILKALNNTYSQPGSEKCEVVNVEKKLQAEPVTTAADTDSRAEDVLAVRAAMYNVLFHIHADTGNLKRGLQVLDQAIRELPRSSHRLLLHKQRVLVKAQLGQSVVLDMQRFTEEGELDCALMWHHVAHCAIDKQQQLSCYQNAINTLQSVDNLKQKVDFLLEFGEWQYSNNFPLLEAQLEIQKSIQIILSSTSDSSQSLGTTEQPEGVIPVSSVFDLREVWCLDGLVRSNTLLALMESKASSRHQQYLFLAYSAVLQIWQVSIEGALEIIKEEQKNSNIPAPPASAASIKKEKEREKEKGKKSKEPPPVEKKPKGLILDASPPSSPEEWAQFECPEEIRQCFRHGSGLHSINSHSIKVQNRTLYYLDILVRELESASLTPLTLPPLHLAEVIARDLSHSRSHSDLYRLRIIKACGYLGLESFSPYRKGLLNLAHIPEDEQMACRKAIALQKERNGYQLKSKIKLEKAPGSEKSAAVGSTSRRWHRYTEQELWLDKASVCLSLGLYQPARSLLAEAHLVAKELKDQTSLAKSYHLLAVLASLEQQHDQALALLEQAQEFVGDEGFWYHLVQSLLNTTAELGGKDMYTQVGRITNKAIRDFRSALEQKPNQAPVLQFYIAKLDARGAVLCHSALRNSCAGQDEKMERLKSVCDALKLSVSVLLQHGYKTSAAETSLELAKCLRELAMLTSIKEEKQRHLLDALSFMQQTVSLQEEVLSSCLRLLPSHESGHYSLPAVRVCVDYRLTLVDLILLMLEMQCEEEKVKARIHSKKSSTEQAVKDYIWSPTDLNPLEQEWMTVAQTLGQMALTQLSVINSLSLDCIETKARSLGMLGKCLRLMALQRDPLHTISLWEGPDKGENGREEKAMKDENEEGASSEESKRKTVEQKFVQASETLAQALSLALQHSLPQVLSQVCVDLLECYGQNDPASSGQYLALLQSCVSCAEMSSVLCAACVDTRQSQLAALLSLQKNLRSSPQYRKSSILSAIDQSLHTLSKAYQHLSINPNHMSFLGEMPLNLKILLLQHSEDGSMLYGAFYEKPKTTENQKGKSTGGLACSRVAKAQVQPTVLLRLQAQAQAFRRLTSQTLLKMSRCHKNVEQDEHFTQQENRKDRELGVHLQAIVKEMGDYLNPVLSQFDFSCFSQRPPLISIGEAARPKDKEERGAADKTVPAGSPEQGEFVVVFADKLLMELPLEALAVLQGDGISSVSRDFSLQVFYTRLQRQQPVESDNKKETKGGKPAKGKGDQSKAIKVAPVNCVLPPHSLPVDTHNFKYIVDPYNEGGDCEWSSTAEIMRKTLQMYSHQFTPLWEGVIGSESTCSPTELERLLVNCSSFIFYGMGRFLAHIQPSRLATLNLAECQMAILFDLVQNSTLPCQSQQEVQESKFCSKTHVPLETPIQCAYLLTLCGAHSVMLNQWSSSARTNAQNMEAIMENLLKKELTSGQSVHTLLVSTTQIYEREAACSSEVDSVEPWASPSAFNFIIYGLPNLVVT